MLPHLLYERMADMGLDFAVVYPTLALFFPAMKDKEVRSAAYRAYNLMAADMFRGLEDRLIPAACIPMDTPAEAAAELEVVIIGGGFGGLLAAARLQEVGITNFRIIEKGGDFGGTWYWNRYPGAQCDIESYVYPPLLEETGYMPKEKYSFAPEIFAHAQRIGRHFKLYERACFQTQVIEARWNEESKRWTITTDRGDVFQTRFLIMSSGPLSRPKLPGIPGIENFKGHTFHTSRWDYEYTGVNRGGSRGSLWSR